MSGDRLGKYRLVRLLATGGMGEVFLAEHDGVQGFKKRVVVKRLLRHLASDPTFVEMFLDEARLAARIAHPHVVQILELGEDGGTFFIAMEWVRGPSAREILRARRREPLPVDAALTIGVAVLHGLHAAHTLLDEEGNPSGFVHRDVSAENVLVSVDGAVKLVDFGIAKALSASTARGTALRGKYGYMAPEQYLRRKVDARTDVFAAGVLLHELLAGVRPFVADNEAGIMHAVLNAPPARLDETRGVPRAVAEVVLRALCKEPYDRFPTAEAMALELEAAATSAGLAIGPSRVRDLARDAFDEDRMATPASASDLGPGTAPLATAMTTSERETVPRAPAPAKRPRRVLVFAGVAAAAGLVIGGARAWSRGETGASNMAAPPALSAPPLAPSAALPVAPAVAAAPAPTPSAVPNDAPAKRSAGRTRPRSAAAAEKSGTGTLALRVRPWAQIFVDGRDVGVSPLAPLELPSGRHRVLLRNKDLGKERAVTADVTRGETTTLRIDLFE